MARLTRNSYKRKIIVFGVLVFMSIALISTGFAAWIMSSDAKENVDGNVTVGVVSDSSISFENIEVYVANGAASCDTLITDQDPATAGIQGANFNFEPLKDDKTGRVRYDGTSFENISIRVKGNLTGADSIGAFTYTLAIPYSVFCAAQKGYITLPNLDFNSDPAPVAGSAKGEGDYYIVPNGSEDPAIVELYGKIDLNTGNTFDLTLSFGWGATFKNMNPSVYYDENADGLAIDDSTVKSTLEDMRAWVMGYNEHPDYLDASKKADFIENYVGTLKYNLQLVAENSYGQ